MRFLLQNKKRTRINLRKINQQFLGELLNHTTAITILREILIHYKHTHITSFNIHTTRTQSYQIHITIQNSLFHECNELENSILKKFLELNFSSLKLSVETEKHDNSWVFKISKNRQSQSNHFWVNHRL